MWKDLGEFGVESQTKHTKSVGTMGRVNSQAGFPSFVTTLEGDAEWFPWVTNSFPKYELTVLYW